VFTTEGRTQTKQPFNIKLRRETTEATKNEARPAAVSNEIATFGAH
jgi:hypothetical protein